MFLLGFLTTNEQHFPYIEGNQARLQALKEKTMVELWIRGRRNDGIIRECTGRYEFGLVEAAKKFKENSTKWLQESFKTPKIMRDMLVQLTNVVKSEDRAKQL